MLNTYFSKAVRKLSLENPNKMFCFWTNSIQINAIAIKGNVMVVVLALYFPNPFLTIHHSYNCYFYYFKNIYLPVCLIVVKVIAYV